MVNERLMTTKELAAYLRVTTRTVAKLLKAGAIPVVRVGALNRYQLDKVIEKLLIPEEVEIIEEVPREEFVGRMIPAENVEKLMKKIQG